MNHPLYVILIVIFMVLSSLEAGNIARGPNIDSPQMSRTPSEISLEHPLDEHELESDDDIVDIPPVAPHIQEEFKMPQKAANSTESHSFFGKIKRRIMDTKWYKSMKHYWSYWKRQFRKDGISERSTRADLKSFKRWNRRNKPSKRYMMPEDSTYEDRDRASRALQYSLIARQIALLYSTPETLDSRSGLCSKYKLVYEYVSDRYRTKFALYESKHEFVMAFKGTTTWQEIFRINLAISKIKCELHGHCGMGHGGFLRAFQHMYGDMQAALNMTRGKPLVVTGHSLGGAFAVLTAHHLAIKKNPILVKGVYTFGTPHVGDLDFAQEFDYLVSSRVEVVQVELADEINKDLITTSPLLGFYQVAQNQRRLILPCINRFDQQCSLPELHYHWYYVTALAKIALKKCGVMKTTRDSNPKQEIISPRLIWSFSETRDDDSVPSQWWSWDTLVRLKRKAVG